MSKKISRCPRCGNFGLWFCGIERKCRNGSCGYEFKIDDENLDVCELSFIQWQLFTSEDVLVVPVDAFISSSSVSPFILKCITNGHEPVKGKWISMDYGCVLEHQIVKAGEWVVKGSSSILIQSDVLHRGAIPFIKFGARKK